MSAHVTDSPAGTPVWINVSRTADVERWVRGVLVGRSARNTAWVEVEVEVGDVVYVAHWANVAPLRDDDEAKP
jgi:co-chaperonin GroES (HSP10)